MARLVTLARSGIFKETPLAPSSAAMPQGAPERLTSEELAVIMRAQDDFVYFLHTVFPLSFEGQKFLCSDGSYSDFALGSFHIEAAALIQAGLASGGKSLQEAIKCSRTQRGLYRCSAARVWTWLPRAAAARPWTWLRAPISTSS